MCGYCIEQAYVIPFLRAELLGDPISIPENFKVNCFLDAKHIDNFLVSQDHHDFPILQELALYRLWDILSGIETDLRASDIFSTFDLASMLDQVSDRLDDKAFGQFLMPSTYESISSFKAKCNQDAIAHSKGLDYLKRYCASQLVSGEMVEPGETSPACSMSSDDANLLLSTAIIAASDKGKDILSFIATRPPKQSSDFVALDLWLQRKVFSYCTRVMGVNFAVDNATVHREEIIEYCLIKNPFSKEDAEKIRKTSIASPQKEATIPLPNFLDMKNH